MNKRRPIIIIEDDLDDQEILAGFGEYHQEDCRVLNQFD